MKKPRRRSLGALSIIFSLLCGAAWASPLRELLQKEVPGTPLPDLGILGAEVPWIETLDQEKTFTVAFKTSSSTGVAQGMDVTHVLAFDKPTQMWREGSLQHEAHGDGAIMGLQACPGYLFIETHINPSAGKILVAEEDLSLYDEFYGGQIMGAFQRGCLVYVHNSVHFAPTHPLEVSLYTCADKFHRTIYPMKPYQEVTLTHIEKIRAEYRRRGEKWFMNHNHHMDPEQFTSRAEDCAVNDETDSLALLISFDNTEFWHPGLKMAGLWLSQLREEIGKLTPGSAPPEALYRGLVKQFTGMSGPCSGLEDFLALFDNDPGLKAKIEKVISHHFDPNRPMRDQWVELDPVWRDAEPMLRFAKVITPDDPGYTQCICVYRKVSSPTEMSYREMLFDQVKSRYGEKPLSFFLEADRLAEIFQPVQ